MKCPDTIFDLVWAKKLYTFLDIYCSIGRGGQPLLYK